MNSRNYQKELDKLIAQIEAEYNTDNGLQTDKEAKRKKLLLHSCCAPCSSYCLIYLAKYFDIIDLYYNPNIAPKDEHDKRSAELNRLIKALKSEYGYSIEFVEGKYEPERFYEMSKGLEDIPEGGERCFKCYRLRMEEVAKLAKDVGADYFTTTLSISPLKNATKINEIGEELERIYSVKHLPSDFKKKEGYKQSVELSKKYDLYRQDYCGCVFSRKESSERVKDNP